MRNGWRLGNEKERDQKTRERDWVAGCKSKRERRVVNGGESEAECCRWLK